MPTPRRAGWIDALPALVAGALVAVSLGVYGRLHAPTGERATDFGGLTIEFASSAAVLRFKSVLTTVVVVLAVAQLLMGLRLRDRLGWPRQIPLWMDGAHRITGTVALVLSLPVAYHCLWSLGFNASDPRVLAHSVLGCAVYGALVLKVVSVRRREGPDWMVPIGGGVLFATICGVWATSALLYLGGRIG